MGWLHMAPSCRAIQYKNQLLRERVAAQGRGRESLVRGILTSNQIIGSDVRKKKKNIYTLTTVSIFLITVTQCYFKFWSFNARMNFDCSVVWRRCIIDNRLYLKDRKGGFALFV